MTSSPETSSPEISSPETLASDRLRVDVHVRPGQHSTLARDVREGLEDRPRSLPPKHFYDTRGSELFDAICDLPEYYPTRTEQRLLERIVDDVLEVARPDVLVELGSGAARKTRTLLEAMLRRGATRYVPVDVSESMLRKSAHVLLADYPALQIHGLVADYDRHLDAIPEEGRRLVAFLGSTIGNFPRAEAVAFLRGVREALGAGDHLLLGLDLVKDHATLAAAYDDAAGVTAAFNRNVLAVINRELGADFDLEAFRHVAFFDGDRERIEMHLESVRAQDVRVPKLELVLHLEAGERIHTEISGKHTRRGAEAMLSEAGYELVRWDDEGPVAGDPAWREGAPDEPWFALALARPKL
ncbi:MAG: L-histidine N(alpha)-methyltransferase [Sandaracinus sp.]|nr:L-histidine N(alpha)-methyltransferase [Sandaracinus sp.]MCB9621626.1 L-histidine N(alpha)-methyltransferase [Sandaracinus sp.]MCB9623169.1 L-histidine N(alpha)-methyltransferase [Sandaracinus sp.]MCB9636396.1 L-histidine N(alpha)-methyltransferase [Sandaracinus sp.]